MARPPPSEALADRLLAAWTGTLAPAPPAPPAELAARLSIGDGPAAGQPWSLRHPAHAAIAAALASWRKLVVCGPVQDGKTYTATVLPVLHQILEDRRAVLLAGPRFEDCAAIYTAKLRGTLLASGLQHVLPDSGKGARHGVPDEVLFATGCRLYMRGLGGANEAQQAAVTARCVVVTEVDSVALSTRYSRRNSAQEGRRKLALIRRRCQAYVPDERFVLESTVKDDEQSVILAEWDSGTRGEVWHPCPRCGGWTTVEWEHLVWEPREPTTVRWKCPLCGREATAEEFARAAAAAVVAYRGQRVDGGRVVGDPPAADHWSLRWSALDSVSPSRALPLLVAEYEAACAAVRERADVAPLRQFVRDHLSRPFEPSRWLERLGGGTLLTGGLVVPARPERLAARAALAQFERGEVPEAAEVLALGIDVQERELWWALVAQTAAREGAWIVDSGVEYICHRHEAPTAAQRHAALDRAYARLHDHITRAAGRLVGIAGVDVGGRGWVDQIDAWLRQHRWRVLAVRGGGGTAPDHSQRRDAHDVYGRRKTALAGWGSLYHRDDGRRLLLLDPQVKVRLIEALQLPPDHPAAVVIPRGVAADDHLVRHLCSEEQREEGGRVVWVVRGKNDLLDATCYALALGRVALQLHQQRQQQARAAGPIEIGEGPVV